MDMTKCSCGSIPTCPVCHGYKQVGVGLDIEVCGACADGDDLLVETYRTPGIASHIFNGVKVTHKPTGLVAACHEERSQRKNRERAVAELRALLAGQDDDNGNPLPAGWFRTIDRAGYSNGRVVVWRRGTNDWAYGRVQRADGFAPTRQDAIVAAGGAHE